VPAGGDIASRQSAYDAPLFKYMQGRPSATGNTPDPAGEIHTPARPHMQAYQEVFVEPPQCISTPDIWRQRPSSAVEIGAEQNSGMQTTTKRPRMLLAEVKGSGAGSGSISVRPSSPYHVRSDGPLARSHNLDESLIKCHDDVTSLAHAPPDPSTRVLDSSVSARPLTRGCGFATKLG
jgi:hypothetical protein